MLNEALLTLSVCLCIYVPCYAGYDTFIKSTPTQVSENVIKYDDQLLLQAKGALLDYQQKPQFGLRPLIKYRERLVNRYQKYKTMKKDNEFQIPRKYMELRMDEFFDFLQTMPPF
jgi:hypothetical protein